MISASGWHPLFSVAGFAVGLLVGLTGVGGGSLMTPVLVLFFGTSPAIAVGTDLLYAAVTKAVGVTVHGARGAVDWRIAGRLTLGSVPAAALTLFVLSQSNVQSYSSGKLISGVLGGALIATAVCLVFRGRILALAAPWMSRIGPRQTALLTVATGAVLGVLVSLSSVGAGAIGVTALLLLYPRLRTSQIVGADIAHAVPLTLVAGIGHWVMGSTDWGLLGQLLLGSIPGICLGSYLSSRVPDGVLRPLLATTLLAVGTRLVI